MASFSQESASGASGFIKLLGLQPLQNFAKNFDIDVASCLDELLRDLQLDHEHDDGDNHYDTETLDFAKAALAVQNTTHIYSRKVDHLYALATTTAEDISADSKKKKEHRSKEMESMDSFFEQHQDPDFLLLDDVPHDAKKEMEVRSARLSLSTRYSLASRGSLSGISVSKDSIEMSRYEDNMLKSRISSSVRELLRGSGSDFLSSSRLSADGCLCLPGSRPFHNFQHDCSAKESLGIDDTMDAPNYHGDDENDFAMHDDGELDADDNDGPGYAFSSAGDDNQVFPIASPPSDAGKQVSFASNTLLSRREDPYEMLDPDIETATKKPLRVGKTIILPAGVKLLPPDLVTGSRTRRMATQVKRKYVPEVQASRSLAIETFQASLAARKRSHSCMEDNSIDDNPALPPIPLKGFYFGSEFEYIARAITKRKAAERRKENRLLANKDSVEQATEEIAHTGGDDDDDDDDGAGGPSSWGNYDNDDDDVDFNGGNGDYFESNTGLASLDDAFNQRTFDDNGTGEGDFDADNSPTFEELCRLHLGNLKDTNSKYMNRTKLAKRVNEWQERMAVVLEEETQRPVFDIHKYGQSVIQLAEKETLRLKKDGVGEGACQSIDFREIVRHQPQHETCRMFLATLSLCCSGNVEVVDNSGGDGSTLSLMLVNAKVDTPMEQYVAPSELIAKH